MGFLREEQGQFLLPRPSGFPPRNFFFAQKHFCNLSGHICFSALVRHVSSSGFDGNECGKTVSSACRSFDHVLSQLTSSPQPVNLDLRTDTSILLNPKSLVWASKVQNMPSQIFFSKWSFSSDVHFFQIGMNNLSYPSIFITKSTQNAPKNISFVLSNVTLGNCSLTLQKVTFLVTNSNTVATHITLKNTAASIRVSRPGMLEVLESDLIVEKCNFSQRKPDRQWPVPADALIVARNSYVRIADSTFTMNQQRLMKMVGSTVNIQKSTFTENHAKTGSCVLEASSCNVSLQDSFFGRHSLSHEGLISTKRGSNLTLTRCKFIHNDQDVSGGSTATAAIQTMESSLFVSSSTFLHNAVGFIAAKSGPVSVKNCSFRNNSAQAVFPWPPYCVGIFFASKIVILNSTFSNNSTSGPVALFVCGGKLIDLKNIAFRVPVEGNQTQIYLDAGVYELSFSQVNFTDIRTREYLSSSQKNFLRRALDVGVLHLTPTAEIKNKSGHEHHYLVVFIGALVGVVLLLLVASIVVFMKKYSKLHGPAPRRKREHDAFVCYPFDEDHEFVFALIPRLENEYDVSLCWAERDFLPGLMIQENIEKSIDSSNCAIILLSQFFIDSPWCQRELYMCSLEQQADPSFRILFILMQVNFQDLKNVPKYVEKYIQTCTCLFKDDRKLVQKIADFLLNGQQHKKETFSSLATNEERDTDFPIPAADCSTQVDFRTPFLDSNRWECFDLVDTLPLEPEASPHSDSLSEEEVNYVALRSECSVHAGEIYKAPGSSSNRTTTEAGLSAPLLAPPEEDTYSYSSTTHLKSVADPIEDDWPKPAEDDVIPRLHSLCSSM